MRRSVFLGMLVLASAVGAQAQATNTISTVAGGGTNAATAAAAYLPGSFGVARDTTNHVTYLSIPSLSVVYKVDAAGNITLYAGNGTLGFSGDGGAATSAQLDAPNGIAVDNGGNLFIADSANNRIRRVDFSTHVITTVAGSGNQYNGVGFFGGYNGDGGPATSALMNFPFAVAVDGNGNLFIADTNNNVIRKVDNSPSHVITTYAGNGTQGNPGTANGDGGAATSAQLSLPSGVAVDSTGDVFIGDSNDSVVRMVDTELTPIITTYAGSAANIFTFSGDGGPANLAGLNFPQGITVDSANNLYIADTFNNRIRKVDGLPPHNISTLAGNAGICLVTTGCGDGGAAASAVLNTPSTVAVDAANGNVFLCDSGTQRYRMVVPGAAPTINAYAGGGSGGDGNAATSAVLGDVPFVTVDAAGDLIVVDGAGARIRKVNAKTQVITDIAGNGIIGPPGPANGDGGPAIQANLTRVNHGIAIGPSGNIYFVDRTNFIVRRIDTAGTITKVAGTYGTRCGAAHLPACGDGGPAASAFLRAPTGIAVDSNENIYISEGGLNRIRVFTVGGNISNFAGTGAAGATNGPAVSATFNAQWGIAFDVNNNLYVADANNNLIRKIDNTAQHNVTTLAFNGQPTFGGDGGSALSASMQFPQQVAVDGAANVYVGGGFDNVVRRIDVNDQTVITIAGDVHNLDGGFRASDDGGPSTNALITNFGLAIFKNTANNTNLLYIADEGNNRIRAVDLAPVAAVTSSLQPFGPELPGAIGNAGLVTITNNGLDDLTVTNASVPAGFTLSNSCFNPATQLPVPVSPVAGACLLVVAFTPPVGAANGMVFNGNLTFNTNDPANPSSSFALSGTVVTTPETLTLNLSGGTGTIAGIPEGLVNGAPAPVLCTSATPPPCTFSFALGQQVTLIAVGSAGSAFTGWTVNGLATTCPGTTPTCTVTMSAAVNVTAAFGPASVSVSGMGTGSGTITSTPAGIDCVVTNGVAGGPTCTFSAFPAGTQSVTLTATAAVGGSTFAGWLGFCGLAGSNTLNSAGTGPCTIPFSIAGVTALNGALATAVFSAQGPRIQAGQVLVGTVDGMIFIYNPDGTLSRVLNSGNLGGTITEMNFDIGGNLYAANPLATNTGPNPGTVEFFMNTGAGPTFDFGLFDSQPSGVLLAPSGNIFVSQSAGQNTLLEFTNVFNGSQPVNTFFPAYENAGVSFMELRDDGASVLYTSNSPSVKNFDILNNHQNPDFATNLPGGPAYALRELGDKSVLVANTTEIVRLNSTGSVVQTYKPGGGGLFFALNLDPDGISFWTGDALSGKVYRLKISDGSIIGTPINTGLGFNAATFNFATIFGIAVLGQPASGGADLAVAVTAPTIDDVNAQITFTATITNNGPLAAAGVTLTDTFPAGVTVNSAVSSQGPCTVAQTVTCTVGAMADLAVVTVTIKATATAAMILSNTVTVSATTLDPIPGNNSFTTSTTVLGAALATITMTAPGSLELGQALTYQIQVTNPGGTTLAGIAVTDTLPGSLNASSLSPGCAGTSSITCTIGNLTPGQIVNLSITTVPAATALLANTANVTGGNSATVNTSVITGGVPLVVEVDSANPADFITTNPSSGVCSQAQLICTSYFPAGMVTVTANGPGFIGWSVNNASSPACPPTSNTCTVTVPALVIAGYSSIAFVQSQLSTGVVGIAYGVDLSHGVIGGVSPYTITLTGTLPNGLTFTAPSISGIPTTPTPPGGVPLTVNITDSVGEKGSTVVMLTIINAPSGQEALANGNYGIVFHLVNDSDGSLFAVAGSLHFNGKGIIDSGTLDTNGNGAGQVPQTLSVTGTYTIGPDHRCLIKLQNVGKSVAVIACSVGDIYQGVAHTARIIEFDDNTGTGERGAGIARLQDPNAFNANSFAGPYIFAGTGQNSTFGRFIEEGLFTVTSTATNTGNFGSGSADANNNGILAIVPSITGTYSEPGLAVPIDPGIGRTQWNLNGGSTTASSFIIDANNVVFITKDPIATSGVIIAGTAERQLNTSPFDATFLSGPDVIAVQGPSNAGKNGNVLIGVGTFTAAAGPNPMTGTLSFTKDSNDSGNVTLEGIENDTYTMAASGRLVLTPSSGKQVFGYLSRPNRGYVMGTDASADFGTIDLQTGGPFTVPALPTDYFFGDREPSSTTRGEDVSGVISLSNGVATATIDQSHEGGRLDYDFSAPFGISLAPAGRLILTHNPSNLIVTSDEIGQVITPSHIIFSEFDPSTNRPTLHEEQSFLMPAGLPLPNPASVNFPVPVASGSNATMTLMFTNASDGLLSFTGVDISKSPDFKIDPSSTCVGAAAVIVLAHSTCTGVVTFAPLAGTPAGPVSETLTLLSDAGNVTITANGTVAGTVTATHFAVSAPALVTAGTAFNITVTALDATNSTVTGYAGTVHFTSSDGAAVLPANSTLTNGVGTFSATMKTAGSRTITATDTVTSSITGTSGNITVNPAAATHLAVSAPAAATAGTAFNFTVTAADQFNNTATGYTGTAHFTSSDGAAVLPANSTLTNGVGNFSATLKTTGSQTITATDTLNGTITGVSGAIIVSAGAATHFLVAAPGAATAGTAFNFTVTALDVANNTATSYGGTVHFTSTDGAAVLPANSTLTNGVGTLAATLKTAGSQTITAHDTVTVALVGTSGSITVNPATATHFAVAAPAIATGGTAFNFTVTAQDQFNNTATGYTGTVHFTSTDGAAVLPANSTLTNGLGTLSATLKAAGNQTITATDTVTATITGTSGTIAVSAAAATHFAVSGQGLVSAGAAFNVTVTAQDAANNTATGYAGIVHFTSTDSAAVLPANSTLTNGVGTFPATLNTVGPQTITAKDTVTASITGISNTITVSAGAAQTANVHLIDNGTGAVGTVVDNSVPQQINCTDATGQLPGPACSTTYPDGTTVTFTATPGAGAAFVNWNGSNVICQAGTPANVCTVTVIGFTSLEANFTNGPGGPFTLTVAPPAGATGGGRVSSGVPSNSLNCTFTGATTSGACTSIPLKSGTVTETIPQADANSTFGGYAGSCPNQFGNNCFVPMSQNQTVTPVFNIIPITLNVAFVGNGTVTSDVGGINCSNPAVPANVCKTTVNSGTVVKLTEAPGAGFAFGSWTPACASPTCTLTLNTTNEPNGSLTVTATFTALPTFILTVTDNGTGSGTVKSQPGLIPSISCTTGTPDGCSGTYNSDTPVTLTATAAAGSTFAGWSGGVPACAGMGTCSVTMTQAQNVTATFNVSTGPALVSIAVTPPNPTIKASATQQFTATGTFSDNSMQDLTASAAWASSDLTIATIGTGANNPGLAMPAGAGGTTKITATSGNIVGTTNLTVAVPVVVTNWNVSGEGPDDKQRVDGKSSPLQIKLTNTSANQIVHVSGVSADNPAFTVTTDCTALGPGQSCNVLASFTTTSTCQNLSANITVADDDPGGSPAISVNGFGADNGLQVDDMTNPAITALSLAQKLIGTGLTISNVTYTGAARAAGTFTSSSNIVGFADGVILSTGSVRNTVGPNCSSGIGVDNGQPGDADLNGLLGGGQTTNDAAVLEFDFVPASPSISFQYVFSSDEYNEFVGQFDDVFGFFLGPKGSALQNIALIPGTNLPVSINNVNGGNPLGTNPTNPQFYINNDFQSPLAAPVDTEMDGLTVVFTAQAQVIPGNTYHIKLAIADALDFALDSNVFIKAGSFTSSAITLSPASLAFGNQPVNSQSPTQPVTMTNTGATPVNIASIVASAPFVDPDNCPKQLAPSGQAGSSCTINVSFQPTSAGAFNGTLTVTDDAPVAGSTQTVALTGTGTAAGPTLVSIAVTPATPTLVVGQQQQFTATGTFSDNSMQDLTSQVAWGSSNMEAATITAGGLATALTGGQNTLISATKAQGDTNIVGSTLLTVTTVPFVLTITPPPGGTTGAPPTVSPGGSLAIGLNLSAAPGFSGTVKLSCVSDQPQFLTCAPAPSSVTLSGNGPKQVAIVLNAFCSGVPTQAPGPEGPGGGLQLLVVALMFGSLALAYRKRWRLALSFAVLMFIAFGSAACSSVPTGPNGRTPAGNYKLFITASAGGSSQTVEVPIMVTP
jgi:uncharacterized repeat protein (TIGR01451 family)